MRLSVLSSGSSGNAAYVECGEGGLLVDAGLSRRRLEKLLARVGRTLHDVDAVLLTHDHSDHTCGAPALSRDFGVPVFAASEVRTGSKLGPMTVAPVGPGEPFEVGGMTVTFFDVPHDSTTCGVRISGDGRDLAVATDLGEVGPETLGWLRGAEAVVLEANHDPEWLARGPYSAHLKRRISSPNGHLSNRQSAQAALALAPHGLKDLVLAHLSKTNNSPARACGTVHGALREGGYGGVRVRAAIANHPTPWIEVGAPIEIPEYTYRYARGDGAGRLFGFE
ncbi:MBL fold metallo-hydrolase [Rubrobacter tropicus]|uniref:MBL fold metallo-hydrolase n=1 Tax=Rubrobacter tropicus TaxID=2653851 RepID=A0A6G8Q9S0_9ACTN|nr:MBL fold metallo-hydrolase [Rubrobacter tropicus]QIN83230.1 MBL fold metallo-hydrolase [Rubrobacter tropicus]